jgi:hypothetical protein
LISPGRPLADLDHLRERLAGLADELADAAMEALREAIAAGERKPARERRLTQARRSVEKAVHLIDGLADDDRRAAEAIDDPE